MQIADLVLDDEMLKQAHDEIEQNTGALGSFPLTSGSADEVNGNG